MPPSPSGLPLGHQRFPGREEDEEKCQCQLGVALPAHSSGCVGSSILETHSKELLGAAAPGFRAKLPLAAVEKNPHKQTDAWRSQEDMEHSSSEGLSQGWPLSRLSLPVILVFRDVTKHRLPQPLRATGSFSEGHTPSSFPAAPVQFPHSGNALGLGGRACREHPPLGKEDSGSPGAKGTNPMDTSLSHPHS